MPIQLRAPSQCRYDLMALGEIILRFNPGERRIRTAREFRTWNLAELESAQV
jgi:2-dehydro-3-deoxygluconokinase